MDGRVNPEAQTSGARAYTRATPARDACTGLTAVEVLIATALLAAAIVLAVYFLGERQQRQLQADADAAFSNVFDVHFHVPDTSTGAKAEIVCQVRNPTRHTLTLNWKPDMLLASGTGWGEGRILSAVDTAHDGVTWRPVDLAAYGAAALTPREAAYFRIALPFTLTRFQEFRTEPLPFTVELKFGRIENTALTQSIIEDLVLLPLNTPRTLDLSALEALP